MAMTKDFSQCQNCIFHKITNNNEVCFQPGTNFILDLKKEDCPDFIPIGLGIEIINDWKDRAERQKKEEKERLEREMREQEEYERTHPKEFWTLRYHYLYPLRYDIWSYSGERSLYPVDDNKIHWDGEDDEEYVYYYSTEEKAYQKYKEVLEEYIKDAEAELLEMRERLTYLKAQGRIK